MQGDKEDILIPVDRAAALLTERLGCEYAASTLTDWHERRKGRFKHYHFVGEVVPAQVGKDPKTRRPIWENVLHFPRALVETWEPPPNPAHTREHGKKWFGRAYGAARSKEGNRVALKARRSKVAELFAGGASTAAIAPSVGLVKPESVQNDLLQSVVEMIERTPKGRETAGAVVIQGVANLLARGEERVEQIIKQTRKHDAIDAAIEADAEIAKREKRAINEIGATQHIPKPSMTRADLLAAGIANDKALAGPLGLLAEVAGVKAAAGVNIDASQQNLTINVEYTNHPVAATAPGADADNTGSKALQRVVLRPPVREIDTG